MRVQTLKRDGVGRSGVESVRPCVLQFFASPDMYLRDDDDGNTHDILQCEGRKQSDALRPAVLFICQQRAFEAVTRSVLPSERLFEFLDDIYVVCPPERAVHMYSILQ